MIQKIFGGLAVVLAVMACVAFCLVCYYIWPEKDSTMPAWIQAVGSILAVLAAVGVMHVQHVRQQEVINRENLDQRASQIFAVYLLNRELFAMIDGLKSSMENRLLEEDAAVYIESHLAGTDDATAMPAWQLHYTDAQELIVNKLLLRAMASGVHAARASHASRLSAKSVPLSQPKGYILAHDIAAVLPNWIEGLEKSRLTLCHRFTEITGKPIPDLGT